MRKQIVDLISFHMNIPIEEISDNDYLIEDIGMDSLDFVEFILSLQDEFGIYISDEDADEFHTVNDIILYVEEHKPC